MKYAAEIGSGARTYIPSFIKIGSGIQKLIWGIHTHTHTHTQHNYLFLFKIRKIGRKEYVQETGEMYVPSLATRNLATKLSYV
jgi:hypothetical protein